MVFLFYTEKNAKIAKYSVNNPGIRNYNATNNVREYEQVDSLLKKREEILGESHFAITCGTVLLETILLFCRQ